MSGRAKLSVTEASCEAVARRRTRQSGRARTSPIADHVTLVFVPRASPRLRNHETVTHGSEKSGLPGLAENCSVKSHAPDVDADGNRNNGTHGRRRMMLMLGVV